MDLTPQVINEVEFSMARRGYDPDQVDEFLEKMAVAVGELTDRVGELRERVVAAERRAQEAERRAGDAGPRVAQAAASAEAVSAAAEAELETMKRTLLLAQRTADAAVREAQEEATRILAAAETEARTAHEETRRQVLDEIAGLEALRDGLRVDAEALEQHIEGQRSRLQGAITDLQRILDEPARLAPTPVPVPEVDPLDDLDGLEELDDVEEDEEAVPEPIRPPAAERQPVEGFSLTENEGDDEAWARFSGAEDDLDAGPRTEPILRLDRLERDADPADDAYLNELRKAMLDDTGAPDAADLGYFDDQGGERATRSPRFGRRR